MTDDTARSDALREALTTDIETAMRGGYVAELPTEVIAERLLAMGWSRALAASAAEPREGLPCCGHPAEEHMWSGGCCICRCPAARPTSAAAQPGTSEPGLREALTRHEPLIEGSADIDGGPRLVCSCGWDSADAAEDEPFMAHVAASCSPEPVPVVVPGVPGREPATSRVGQGGPTGSGELRHALHRADVRMRAAGVSQGTSALVLAIVRSELAASRHADEHPEWRDEPLEGGSGG